MSIPIDERRRTSFDARAVQYDAVRPTYPETLIDDLVALSAIPPGGLVLDVGAGTGKATLPLARRGYEVIAIEPSANMAAVLRANLDGARVTMEQTTFEHYQPVRAIDVLLSAQAFHWVDPRVRYAKAAAVLRPGGAIALLRNDMADLDPDLHAELDRAYAEHLPQSRHRDAAAVRAEITAEIDASGRFGPVEVRTAAWTATYSTADYIRLLETYSDHATLESSRKARLHEAIAAAIDRRGGAITIPNIAALHLARVVRRP
jgi:SAM-dependent methyltransferase